MEITSVKSEEQDEIEKIPLIVDENKTTSMGKLDQYIPKLAEFEKNDLEWKRVDAEYSVAYASSAAALFSGTLTVVIVLIGFIAPAEVLKAALPLLAVLPFSANYFMFGKDGDKRNKRLHVLKKALIGK
jgi:hypothetical protein